MTGDTKFGLVIQRLFEPFSSPLSCFSVDAKTYPFKKPKLERNRERSSKPLFRPEKRHDQYKEKKRAFDPDKTRKNWGGGESRLVERFGQLVSSQMVCYMRRG